MENTSCNINISKDNQMFSIYYTFNQITTFQDLLEYFAYLYPSLKICQCYDFQVMLNNYNYFLITKETKLVEYSKYINNNNYIIIKQNVFMKIIIFYFLVKQIYLIHFLNSLMP